MAGWEARALPLCYVVNFSNLFRIVRLDILESVLNTDNLERISKGKYHGRGISDKLLYYQQDSFT